MFDCYTIRINQTGSKKKGFRQPEKGQVLIDNEVLVYRGSFLPERTAEKACPLIVFGRVTKELEGKIFRS